jgi:Na+-translocating ferredoxin:NAD+ oxidoreductase RNF subunit RnfB
MTEEIWSYDTYRCGKCYYEGCEPCPDHLPNNEKTVTMKLTHYEDIVSNLDKARREADFYKAQYESLREELKYEQQTT